jgi:ABC-type phosphate/phosphonate transport system substrate-binding protein
MTLFKGLWAGTLLALASFPIFAQAPAAPAASPGQQTYILTVEPNLPARQAQQVYKPLLDYLAKATGHRFTLRVGANYHVFWRDLRAATKTDFAFEEAHFTDYRIQRQGFVPLVRTTENTRYMLLADAAIAEEGINGLVGYRVVSMPAPSMGYLLLGELYKNPLAQPEVQSVAANWKDGVEMIFAGETEAAMVPNYIANQYPNLVTVSESREFTGRALSAAGTVPAAVRKAVTEAMLKLHEDPALNEVLTELGTTQFITTNRGEYVEDERLLRGVFGYTPPPRAAEPAAAEAASAGVSVSADDDAE